MSLESINFHGLGAFTSTPGGFRVDRYHLEEPWSYIYTTSKILLKVDQHGPDYVQFTPPGGALLARRERYQAYPPFFVWIRTSESRAFSNFFKPVVGEVDAFEEPDEFYCDYSPNRARYHVVVDGIGCDTELFVPADNAVVVMACTVTNMGGEDREFELLPVMRPHLAAGSLAPWDVPSGYQKVGYSNEENHLFFLELRSPAGIPEQRQYAFVLCDLCEPDSAEVNYSSFVGRGTFDNPQAMRGGALGVDTSRRFDYGDWTIENSVDGQQAIVALHKKLRLAAGESFAFTTVLGCADVNAQGKPPTLSEISKSGRYFDAGYREQAVGSVLGGITDLLGKRSIKTPDAAFNRYVNEYLPLQLKWVQVLDRGWPTGMRGVRDNSQDVTALVPLDPESSRKTLLALFDVQRSDGWFPRQYSTKGKHGTHDLRNYVDGGVWVWELLYEYLCWTKDFGLLHEKVGCLDCDEQTDVLDHILRAIRYYTLEANIGEHGLCLIREGDWNDSVNRAGLEGRGESVMVTCQVVLMLRQAAELVGYLMRSNEAYRGIEGLADEFASKANEFKANLLKHALNEQGYLNGVFTDNGEWVFSPNDPDGRKRVNVPVNAFGIISGVLDGDKARRALSILASLKQRDGWPLFDPAIGDPPIAKLGRIGQGDLAPGLGENGTPYNHGCHGFFGRAAAVSGDGDLLLEILRYMLPYDQDCHPVERTKTAPYGVVNHWKTAQGLSGRGGDCFLSGSISTALRNVYNGMFGIRPMLDCLALDPALPGEWAEALVRCSYMGAELEIDYRRDQAAYLLLNGEQMHERRMDSVSGKQYWVIPDGMFEQGKQYRIVCGRGRPDKLTSESMFVTMSAV